jgi:hypothetical protein
MATFYFTFGQDHVDNTGRKLKDYYFVVFAKNYARARQAFINSYASHALPRDSQWSHQYNEDSFEAKYYAKGELGRIEVQEDMTIENNET